MVLAKSSIFLGSPATRSHPASRLKFPGFKAHTTPSHFPTSWIPTQEFFPHVECYFAILPRLSPRHMWFFMTLICSSICSFFLSVCERTTRRCATPRAQMPNKSNPFTSMEMFRQSISIQVVIKITKKNLNPTCLVRYTFRLSSKKHVLFHSVFHPTKQHHKTSISLSPPRPFLAFIFTGWGLGPARHLPRRGRCHHGPFLPPSGFITVPESSPKNFKKLTQTNQVHLKNELRFWKRQTNS